ncbi:PREDICTED: probable glutathione S-transferase [Nelumbo nucifera]|uniref:Glutathione S-transferase n=2 Tax=Nelumbo nucifera TaxID=4432 RepID=A0A822YH72_NELNU|nr:PREDICTED: probable glutathione S-transferase [Nelumbo nucifera]DAD31940.1 TPA_asm: hypothetical protein HUJ06_010791 [Nelumbo nucifera]
MGEVKVVGSSPSLFCYRIEWALKLQGIEYEYLKEDLRNKSPLLLKYNPVHKKVPVFLHNGRPIAESLVILEYIDETWKNNPLLPEDPHERALARFWAKFGDEKCLMGAWAALCAEGPEKEKAVETAMETLNYLEKQIEGKKFFGGKTIGFLDLVIGWIPHWLDVLDEVGGMKLFDAERFPCLHEWAQNFIQIPIIKDCHPPRDEMVAYFQSSRQYMLSLAAKK